MNVFEFIDRLLLVALVAHGILAAAMVLLGVWAARLLWRQHRALRRWSRALDAAEALPVPADGSLTEAEAEAFDRLAEAVRRDRGERR
ncbi:hypothetical protein QNO07_09615 [Streptomyces sp. 549]|uniref:hypothetical protein n=1 Tax=Streptomyces sp. 549 TaxID=3049076 RepID=UPI0024C383C5|nr:hypothetical protein [Streptomyces sp. 549]MDK1473677.1 hypothetical protein [Streptomyces sp. 549]